MFVLGLIELCSQTHGGDYDCSWLVPSLWEGEGQGAYQLDLDIVLSTYSKQQKLQHGKFSNVSNTSCLPKQHRQTAQTQIRLLLKKQSDQGLPCLLFWNSFPALKTNILFENRKRKVFKNLEHLPYSWKILSNFVEFQNNHGHNCLHKMIRSTFGNPAGRPTGCMLPGRETQLVPSKHPEAGHHWPAS